MEVGISSCGLCDKLAAMPAGVASIGPRFAMALRRHYATSLAVILLLGSSEICGVAAAKKGKKKADAEDGFDRMQVEMDANGGTGEPPPQSPEMAAEEAKAVAGLASDIKASLTDIMAILLHGSGPSQEQAIEQLIHLAASTSEAGPTQARLFRSAVVAGGALPALIAALSAGPDASPSKVFLAATAMHALAHDDPTTDDDNFHAREICESGAVPPLVKLLEAEDPRVQGAATNALSSLAENPMCQSMIAAAGAIAPLVSMAQYAPDMLKLGALSALDVLSVNNADVVRQLGSEGAPEVLQGLASMGSGLLREEAKGFSTRLSEQPTAKRLNDQEHAKAARQTRQRYDGVRQRAFRRMQGWGDDAPNGQG
jgi:hypothetical protein